MAEVRRAIQMVEMACGMPSLMMGDSLNDVAAGIDCKTIRQPIGVCAGITPFNFPAMAPMWMHPFAIACGNTFVLKPSEKVPLTPTYAVQLLHEAQRDLDFHGQREIRARVFQPVRGGDGGSERGRGRSHGFLPVRRLAALLLRRPACTWERRGGVLHGAEGDYEPVVVIWVGRASWPAFRAVRTIRPKKAGGPTDTVGAPARPTKTATPRPFVAVYYR
jgi:hypothetical protein